MPHLSFEPAFLKSVVTSTTKKSVAVVPFIPERREPPSRSIPVDSAWKGIESIIGPLLRQFNVGRKKCLEFGVEYGYSTVALSSFFDSVIGVDTFLGDQHTDNKGDIFSETKEQLSGYRNITLVRSDFRSWIEQDNNHYDLIHVDIVHKYKDTFECGLWSALHSTCTIFHDTESFIAVKRAVRDIARETNKLVYNFPESNGLGIVVAH